MSRFGVDSFPGGVLPGWSPPRDGGFPRRESPRGLGSSDEPIKKHYAHIKEEFISLVLHSARSLSVNEDQQSRCLTVAKEVSVQFARSG